jgi:hypothetical protein
MELAYFCTLYFAVSKEGEEVRGQELVCFHFSEVREEREWGGGRGKEEESLIPARRAKDHS